MRAAGPPKIVAADWLQGTSATLMARVEDRPLAPLVRGAPLTQADLSSALLSVWDITDPAAPSAVDGFDGVALSIADVVFDTLQPWSVDGIGFNFCAVVPGSAFPTAGARYQAQVIWQHIDGRTGATRWVGGAAPVYSD